MSNSFVHNVAFVSFMQFMNFDQFVEQVIGFMNCEFRVRLAAHFSYTDR